MLIMKNLSSYILPLLLASIILIGMYRRVKVYEVFINGAKDGISIVFKIMPTLIGLLLGIGVLRASGILDLITQGLKPLADLFGIPSEALPLAMLRPFSGSASIALVSESLKTYGPDSFIGRVVSTMMGSTETIFYTLAIYFGAVNIKHIRYTLFAAIIADIVSIVSSVWVCRIMF